ncbi:MAG: dTDP-4-dehydrorhamnose 3,5-epimerase [Acaryochloridaceae cyanobacterium SU_2_1]|nr:dTDP-4-dehydrorhamnose 3,5-epimerase [Acaryochloridaceae cyanobacterium SU_2_1]NJM95783.1 dTDP-4-dehydrorhamnose 3,5-epimerase [Acaryochloridaceae cyanobacterium CSU_5_19]
MKIRPASLEGILRIEPQVFTDDRGFFLESYHAQKCAEAGLCHTFVQDNHSSSSQGTLRGLHFQRQYPQGKLVRVVLGEVFDVAVDIRLGSPTFGQWYGEYLSAENYQQLFIPPGFAHGFLVTSDRAEFLYKCTEYYRPEDDYGLRWNDPSLAIDWPVTEPLLSAKDAALPCLTEIQDQLPCYTELQA